PIFAEVDYRVDGTEPSNKRARKQVWIQGRYKLIWDDLAGVAELYDLSGDPSERENLVQTKPDRVRQMLAAMRAFHETLEASSEPAQTLEPTQEELEALRELGYVGGTDEEESAPSGDDGSGRGS
ncbi:MAG: hypothetical protein JRH19_17515, partial [Deltaproteobacteria bacterium]|nr:hypothetical protein [Deltaproteobacteria bacterium]